MATTTPVQQGLVADASREGVFDPRIIHDRLAGDVELIVEVIEMFLGDYPQMVADVRAAVDARDSHSLERAAHKLRGSIGNFSVTAAYRAAAALETLGHDGALDEAPKAFASLQIAIEEFAAALRQFASEQSGVASEPSHAQ